MHETGYNYLTNSRFLLSLTNDFMKHLFFSNLLGLVLLSSVLFAQAQSVTYNGIAINAAGQRVTSSPISLRLSVHNGSATGTAMYVETQSATTDGTGVFTVRVGQGSVVTGTFGSINWGLNVHYLKVEMDPSAGTNYSIVYNGPITATASIFHTTLATVSSASISDIAQVTATSGGDVTNNGGTAVTVRGVCWSTEANPSIADSHTTDGSGSGIFVSNITGLTAGTLYHVRAYATNSVGTAYGNDISFTTLVAFTCGSSLTINHAAGDVAPVNKTVTYGTVTNIPGATTKCWITSNLGADHQATAVDDVTEASAGWFWQFNHKQGYKSDGSNVTPAWTITSISEYSDWLTANDPCSLELGSGWRLPTVSEWSNVDAAGNWTTWMGPWNSGLKLHAAGDLSSNDGLDYLRGVYGYYWSSAQNTNNGGYSGYVEYLYSGYSGLNQCGKAFGASIRCIKD